MKRFTTILLTLVVLTTTEVEQLLRLPLLVEHFIVHAQATGKIGVEDFLSIHYGGADTDSDETEDQRLPFKTTDTHHLSFLYLVQSPAALMPLVPANASDTDEKLGDSFLPGYLPAIFRPPQPHSEHLKA